MQRGGGGRTIKKTRIGLFRFEIAFAMPVLIALLYYMHDLPKLKQINSRMRFCAYCMASMLQEVSQNRENKKITLADLKNVAASAFLTIYPGKTAYPTSTERYIYGHFLDCFVHCVKGVNGKASVLWNKRICSYIGTGPSNVSVTNFTTVSHWSSLVKYQQNVAPSSIYKDLTVKNGETKIIVECLSYIDINYGFTDGRPPTTSAREKFGFWIFNPEGTSVTGRGYFNQVVIFTPKPGLFDETPPS
jgi:hypothetical protein